MPLSVSPGIRYIRVEIRKSRRQKSGPTYAAIVGGTIFFHFQKIIFQRISILGWIRLFTACCDSRPASSNDSQPNLQRFAAIITVIRDKYYAKRKKFGLSAGLARSKRQGGRGARGRASGDWHSTHATWGKRRRFLPLFPPCCIRRGFVGAYIFRVSSALGQAGIADRKYAAASPGPGVDSECNLFSQRQ